MSESLLEGTTAKYVGQFYDLDGVQVPAVSVTAVRVSHLDLDSEVYINGRQNQDVLGVNGGAFSGNDFELILDPADMAILNQLLSAEQHVLEWEFEYGTPTKTGGARTFFSITNFRRVN